MNNFSLIYLAAGTGIRLKKKIPKQFLLLGGKPIIIHSLEVINHIEQIKEIIITVPEEYKSKTEKILKNFGLLNDKTILIIGGKTRQESVYLALIKSKYENIIIHESSRPFVYKDDFLKLIKTKEKNVTFTTKIPFTVLEQENNYISKILERNKLINIQLPQKFDKSELLDSHEKAIKQNKNFTDDSSLVFYYGHKVKIIEGKTENIKITYPIDLIIGEAIYEQNN